MALTDAQLALIRNEVGSNPDDASLQAIYDRVATLYGTALEVQSQRLADFRANPAQFSVAGEYGQNVAANIAALTEHVAQLVAKAAAEAAGADPFELTSGLVTTTVPTRTWRR